MSSGWQRKSHLWRRLIWEKRLAFPLRGATHQKVGGFINENTQSQNSLRSSLEPNRGHSNSDASELSSFVSLLFLKVLPSLPIPSISFRYSGVGEVTVRSCGSSPRLTPVCLSFPSLRFSPFVTICENEAFCCSDGFSPVFDSRAGGSFPVRRQCVLAYCVFGFAVL